MPIAGYFINLDRSTDRRAAMEAQFRALDPPIAYQRFPAIDGTATGIQNAHLNPAEVGCFMSHAALLRGQIGGTRHVHVLEDDALLSRRMAAYLDAIITSGILDRCDMLFTETLVPINGAVARDARRRYRDNIRRDPDGTAHITRLDIVTYTSSSSSYLVNRSAIGKVSRLLDDALAAGLTTPFDIFLQDRAKRGALRIACAFPFITSVKPAGFASTIKQDTTRPAAARNSWTAASTLAVDLMRHSFFVDCDMRDGLEMARALGAGSETDLQGQMHAALAAFAISDEAQL